MNRKILIQRKLAVIIFFVLVALVSFKGMGATAEAPSIKQKFEQANQFFEKSDLTSAEPLYLELISYGYSGKALYYNLANLYFRKGERGKAILWYERAKRLAPRDSDINFNLSIAKSHLKDEKENLTENMFLFFTNKEIGIGLLVIVWLFFGFIGSRILGWVKPEPLWVPVLSWTGGVLLLVFVLFFSMNTYYSMKATAIVVIPPGEVRNGPGNDYAVGFTVPEGTHVRILETRPSWVQVGVDQQGLKGWMPKNEVELISGLSN